MEGVLTKMKGKKIKNVNMIYPDNNEILERVYISYNKALAKVLVETLSPEAIDFIILKLEFKETLKNK